LVKIKKEQAPSLMVLYLAGEKSYNLDARNGVFA